MATLAVFACGSGIMVVINGRSLKAISNRSLAHAPRIRSAADVPVFAKRMPTGPGNSIDSSKGLLITTVITSCVGPENLRCHISDVNNKVIGMRISGCFERLTP